MAPSGTSGRSSSTASRPFEKGTPEKVSPRSNAAPSRLKLRWSSSANLLLAGHLAGQHPRRQRQPRQDADLLLARLGEEEVGRPLAEDVVDDLHRLHAGVLDRLERLLDPLDADAVEADLAGLDQVVAEAEHLGVVVEVGGRAVQLQQIDRLGPQVLQAAVDEAPSGSSCCSPRPSAWGAAGPPWWRCRTGPCAPCAAAPAAAREWPSP